LVAAEAVEALLLLELEPTPDTLMMVSFRD